MATAQVHEISPHAEQCTDTSQRQQDFNIKNVNKSCQTYHAINPVPASSPLGGIFLSLVGGLAQAMSQTKEGQADPNLTALHQKIKTFSANTIKELLTNPQSTLFFKHRKNCTEKCRYGNTNKFIHHTLTLKTHGTTIS